MIDILLSNGDAAEAETPETAVYAALVLIEEASAATYHSLITPTASFYVDGKCVASDLNEVYLRSQSRSLVEDLT